MQGWIVQGREDLIYRTDMCTCGLIAILQNRVHSDPLSSFHELPTEDHCGPQGPYRLFKWHEGKQGRQMAMESNVQRCGTV